MNQYEIDFKQGYDTANEEWVDRIKQAREEIQQAYEDFDGYDPNALCGYSSRVDEILDRLIAESEGVND